MRKRLAFLALVAACGRVGFGPTVDAAPDAAPQLVAFGAARPLANVSSSSREFGVSISKNELEMYFVSNRSGSYLMYETTRPTINDDFASASTAQFGAANIDAEPGLARGGLEMYLGSAVDIRHAQRGAIGQAWSVTTSVSELAGFSGIDVGAQDQRLVMFGLADNQLYESVRIGGVPQAPVKLGELVGNRANQNYPCMTDDGLEIIFQAYNATGTGTILHAIRPALDQPFGTAAPVLDVPTGVSIGDPAISADGRTLYYGSDENEPNADLWIATRP